MRFVRWIRPTPCRTGSACPDGIVRASTALESVSSQGFYWNIRPPPLRFHEATQTRGDGVTRHRIYTTSVASVYPHYIAKAEKKGRTKAEVDTIISWLTGYSQQELEAHLSRRTDFETFFAEAPRLNPARASIKGMVCGVRLEDIDEPVMREIRYLDKLIDELAKGKVMEKILRQ